MTLRRKSREFALQMLFEWDVTRQETGRVEKEFWKSAGAADSTRKFANQLFEGAVAQAESDRPVGYQTLGQLAAGTAGGRRPQHSAARDL